MFKVKSAPQQQPLAEIELAGSERADPASVRARIATPEAYQVAGLRYHPGLGAARITARASSAPGGVSLMLENLPADAGALDLLVTVSDRLSLSMAEYRVDFRNGPREVAPSPAGTYLAAREMQVNVRTQNANPVQARPAGMDAAPEAALPAPAVDEQMAAARAALEEWARAWSARDFDGYIAAYAPDFKGQQTAGSRAQWVEQRRSRITERRAISVGISNLRIVHEGSAMVARFTQRYKSDAHQDTTQKRIDFVAAGDRWLIVRESTGR